ncbi:MAG TPA: hypothetical protein VHO06_20970 [Polyangia bacterium]|nr:hypothetical protein [Polyangia bacterium]
MRKASTLVGLTLFLVGAGARAQEAPSPAAAAPAPAAAVPAPAPEVWMPGALAPTPPPPKRLAISLAFIPMGVGKYTTQLGANSATGDALFAYGGGFSATYLLIGGLRLGIAPQVVYNVNYKVNPSQLMLPPAAKEYDLLGRVQYVFPIVDAITLYLEALPGWSIISLPGASAAKGLVVAAGGGAEMEMGDRAFINMGIGYQLGFQKVSPAGTAVDNKTRYLRVVLGGGVRF